jgi:hypothetical protein|tara:strand:+ start:1237 stop:1605 length:369 start_codon:yes stop_codon:yes gene_type:complete
MKTLKNVEEKLDKINVCLCYNNEDGVNEFTFGIPNDSKFTPTLSEEDVVIGRWEVHMNKNDLYQLVPVLLNKLDGFIEIQPNKIRCDLKNKFGKWGMRSYILKSVIDQYFDSHWIPVQGVTS